MIVIPRLNYKICRLITPLKIIDAMAFKTLLIVSDLPALRYMVIPDVTGIIFEPHNSKELAKNIEMYFYKKIIQRAYNNLSKCFDQNLNLFNQ